LISNGSEELSKRPGKSLQVMIHENGAPRTTRRRGTISVKTNPKKKQWTKKFTVRRTTEMITSNCR